MPWSYRPALDGLRSVAVYLVLLFHTGMSFVGGGFIGVDLFFVLSGFLVTNVILSEIDRTGRLRFGRFYARRVRRLLPAAVAVVVATSALFLIIAPITRRLPLVQDAQSALLYVANWNFLFQQNDYFAEGVDGSPFLHFWSLAIEEQFYFVFPLVLVLLVKASGRWRWALLGTLAALFLASLGSQLYWAQVDTSWAYYGTDARLYQLLAGALLAVAMRGVARGGVARGGHAGPATPAVAPAAAQGVALAGLIAMVVLGSGLLEMTPSTRGIVATFASLALVYGLMRSPDLPLSRLFSMRAPVFLGKVSYGTYLWHWPVILVLQEFVAVRPLVLAAIAVVVSTGLAALSFELLELPIRTATALHRFSWSAAVAGVTASALVAVTVVPTVLESERTPRVVATEVAAAPALVSTVDVGPSADRVTAADRRARVPKGVDWQEVLDDKGPRSGCSLEDPQACTVVKGSGPHILLVGDSHARMLGAMFTELARDHDLTLSLNVMPGCPWQEGLLIDGQNDATEANCKSLREDWYDQALPELDPDLVVLATDSRDDTEKWEGNLVAADGSDGPLPELIYDSTLRTTEKITGTGARVLIVDNMIGTGDVGAVNCLSAATRLEQCQVPMPAEAPISDAYYRIAADRNPEVFTVDINPIVCKGEPVCLPMVDGIVVWKNRNHFTTMITTHLRGEIWRSIRRTGALKGL